MTALDGICEVCGREREIVGVAAVPGAPISLAWCRECLEHGTQPKWIVDYYGEDCPEGDNPANHLADWLLQERVFHDGEYISVEDYYRTVWRHT